MHPILYDFGFYPLRTYGLMLALGFLAALFFSRRQSKRLGIDTALVSDLFIWVLGGGILGARLLYIVIHPEEFSNPLLVFAIWKGGLVYYGGFLGGALGGYLFSRRHKIKILELSDLALPAAMLGQAIGRWGCFMAGCCYGKAVDLGFPLGVAFPKSEFSLIPPACQNADPAHPTCLLHPTQLYNSANALVLWLLLWFLLARRRYRGQGTAAFLLLYPVTRSLLETLRGDYHERVFWGPLSTSQWTSVPLFLLGLYLLFTCRKRPAPAPAGVDRKG